ncbi:sugar isomerase [Maribacter sp. 2304DJ31-5]|uniref:sugar isomerase n=1 Tax=Maribacter sp. 2304DJ31-5 TaxID=3386273 RepID=UPI0039BC32A0
MTVFRVALRRISPEQLFMGSVLLVNGGNYLYNLILGRLLGPEAFADAALLVTLLLVLSFLGMTFQLATAKFAVLFSEGQWEAFQNLMYRYAGFFGLLVGAILIGFSSNLQQIFHTGTQWMFTVFGVAIPLYFFMSVNRGKYQGRQEFGKLSITYQTEMWSRLSITLGLLLYVPVEPALLVAIGIALSFVFGLVPSDFRGVSILKPKMLAPEHKKSVSNFIVLTACYELTQIMINNSDVLLVKHYFDSLDAGLYASLALIGRVTYFMTWMFIMLLLPVVVQKQKDGEATAPVLFKYAGYVGLLSLMIVTTCYVCPELIIELMFGKVYISMAPLLWQYALATSLFAISNIFAYYFLSLNHYIPVILCGILGLSQLVLITFFHRSLAMVVQMQIMAMIALLVAQLLYFTRKELMK